MKLLTCYTVAAALPLAEASAATYFFTFGDSYTQTGFNVNGQQPSTSNPMGNPELGKDTTTGGINWPGYLTTVDNESLVLNYNFAVGGATTDNEIVLSNGPVKDLVGQVDDFHSAYGDKPSSTPWSSDNAVFGIWMGINDIGRSLYFDRNASASQVIPALTKQYESLVEELYSDGGRKFLFLNIPATSRSPETMSRGPEMVKKTAAWIKAYNTALGLMVRRLESEYEDIEIVLYDSWSFMNSILDEPEKHGFLNEICEAENGESCVWWNQFHPGWKYHKLQAADMKGFLEDFGGW